MQTETAKLHALGYLALQALEDLVLAQASLPKDDGRLRLANERFHVAEMNYFNFRTHLEQEAAQLLGTNQIVNPPLLGQIKLQK